MPIPLQPPTSIPDLTTALARLAAAPATERPTVYRNEVFPFAAARLLAGRHEQPAARLLIVPVGTQPFAPLLAALATPATRVALLVTGETQTFADEVAAALATLPEANRPECRQFAIGDANSGIDVCRAVDAALFWASDPWPGEVTLDVTGGRKATSAALGALAGLRGFRQVYIESRQHRDKEGLFTDERLLVLDDVRAWLHEDERAAATALLKAGAFAAAAEAFAQLGERMLAGPALAWMREFAAAAAEPQLADRKHRFATLRDDLPDGPIRATLAAAAERGEATAADAQQLIDALLEEGAWR